MFLTGKMWQPAQRTPPHACTHDFCALRNEEGRTSCTWNCIWRKHTWTTTWRKECHGNRGWFAFVHWNETLYIYRHTTWTKQDDVASTKCQKFGPHHVHTVCIHTCLALSDTCVTEGQLLQTYTALNIQWPSLYEILAQRFAQAEGRNTCFLTRRKVHVKIASFTHLSCLSVVHIQSWQLARKSEAAARRETCDDNVISKWLWILIRFEDLKLEAGMKWRGKIMYDSNLFWSEGEPGGLLLSGGFQTSVRVIEKLRVDSTDWLVGPVARLLLPVEIHA